MEHPWQVKEREMTERSRAEARIRELVSENMRRPKPSISPTTATVAQTGTALDLDRLKMLLLEMPPLDQGVVALTAQQLAMLKATTLKQAQDDLGTFGLAVMAPDMLVRTAIDRLVPTASEEAKAFMVRWVMMAMVNPISGPPFPRGKLME